MARTAHTVKALTADAGVSQPVASYQAVDAITGAGNGIAFACPKGGKFFIHVKNTNGSARVATVKASDEGLAKNQGDLAVTVGATTGEQWIYLENLDRFKQSDGKVYVEFAASMTGYVQAFSHP